MKTMQWKVQRESTGKYHVKLNEQYIPGIILGGNGRWIVLVRGSQIQETFSTRNDAAERLVRDHIGIQGEHNES